ncbi:MAG: sigma-54-dependent transcriptional regulator [Myxococcota bacterium]
MGASILILEDEERFREDLALLLRRRGYAVTTCGDAQEGIAIARDTRPDVLLCDVVMPGGGATAVLSGLGGIDTGVIVMTAYGALETAVEAFRMGAVDYLMKPLNLDELLAKIERFCENLEVRRRLQAMRRDVSVQRGGGDLIGESAAIRAVRSLVSRVASKRATVLVTGETGTGKDVVARALHAESPWHEERFVAVNCAAFPETLLESELFGHLRGAFTGAIKDKTGLFEAARGGTLFLDEIGETSLVVQSKLLRAVERHEITPIGATRARAIDLRVVAATNRSLDELVRAGSFRQDLLFRLRVLEVHLPPLRDRREDVPLLTEHFLRHFRAEIGSEVTSVDPTAMRALQAYTWPGNVRELRNVLERAAILCRHPVIGQHDLPPNVATCDEPVPATEDLRAALRVFEREHIRRVLAACGGDKEEAARRLGVDVSTLYRKLTPTGQA